MAETNATSGNDFFSWDGFNSLVTNVGGAVETFKKAKGKVDGLKKTPDNPANRPPPTNSNFNGADLFSFGEGAFGGLSGMQLLLVGGAVVGLVVFMKVTK